MSSKELLAILASVGLPNVFNPYKDVCPVFDVKGAPRIRLQAIAEILSAAESVEVDSIWIGRDLGYRGGRRTGLALTDDVHFHDHLDRWGVCAKSPVKKMEVSEKTATVIWGVLSRVESPIFLWNVFPFHPHEPGNFFTNRAHSASERALGVEILKAMLTLLRPKRIVCVGNDAFSAICRISTSSKVIKVRHPSYGGQSEFIKQASEEYDIPLSDYGWSI